MNIAVLSAGYVDKILAIELLALSSKDYLLAAALAKGFLSSKKRFWRLEAATLNALMDLF